jgi:hypothetical protein
MKKTPFFCPVLIFALMAFLAVKPASADIIVGPDGAGIVSAQDALIFTADVEPGGTTAGGTFTHRYTFGFEASGTAEAGFFEIADIVDLLGSLQGPSIPGPVEFGPGRAAISAEFATIATGGATPYTLTVTGRLLDGAQSGSYAGVIRMLAVPEPATTGLLAVALLFAFRTSRLRPSAGAR